MLYETMQECNNYFVCDVLYSDFEVSEGKLTLPLLDGQYFIVHGSVLNDGLHQYGDTDLKDETFTGCIHVCKIPQAFINLASEIKEWRDKYETPFTSESFEGYSYSKASGKSGALTWQDNFRSRLNAWRKV